MKTICSSLILIFAIAITACMPVYDIDASGETRSTDEIQEAEYINSLSLHVPDEIAGEWVTSAGQEWSVSNAGITQPWNCACYPNPVTPLQFLSVGGSVVEKCGPWGYSFHASAHFPWKDYTLYGECNVEVDLDTGRLNGQAAVRQ